MEDYSDAENSNNSRDIEALDCFFEDKFEILSFEFSYDGLSNLKKLPDGRDWPVVYMLHNSEEMYVGETCSMENRFGQHLKNPQRDDLKKAEVIFDSKFNKSAVLDIERSLIQLYSADRKFKLQNMNAGQSAKHNYYQRELYANKLNYIWDELRKMGLADESYNSLKNSDFFKYSPYISLTEEQDSICKNVLSDLLEKLSEGENGVSIIHGSAGTGKTIMAINMIFTLINADRIKMDAAEETVGYSDEQLAVHELHKFVKERGGLKIAFVLPMTSLRKTMKKIFTEIDGLSSSVVMGPSDIAKEKYDVIFVDESHRLSQRKNLANMKSFDDTCKALDFEPKKTTQLDWIMKSGKYQVLFYDEDQSVKGSDITTHQFRDALGENVSEYRLKTQMRCVAGNLYPLFLKDIFDCVDCVREFKAGISGYDLKIFDDVNDMVESIKKLNGEMGLCRNVAGYSWKWISKGKSREEIESQHLEDIKIGPYRYVWNMSNVEWILRDESINEIGCIHTTQGYDLNYVGVIFGYEIDYDPFNDRIVIDLSQFYDTNVKKSVDSYVVRRYILNTYKTMMLRGIKGCYVYACNLNMRKYLKKYIDTMVME